MTGRLPARLLVVTDRHGTDRPLVDTVRACLEGGARWIWLRDRDLDRVARRDLALDLLSFVRAAGGVLTIGSDASLAEEIGADGLHLGTAQLDGCDDTSSRLLGVSAHAIDDIRSASEAGAAYATLSPIFSTASKPGYGPALGLAGLREASTRGLPLVALGGIDPDRASECLEAGASGVAVMGALMRAPDPEAATRRFFEALERAS